MVRLATFVFTLLTTTALAQTKPAPQAQIPAQPLIQALTAFAAQTGLQLMYVSDIADGRPSKGAPAGLTPEQTLTRLLEGTHLTYEFLNERTVAIRSPDNGLGMSQSSTGAADPNAAGMGTTTSLLEQEREGTR